MKSQELRDESFLIQPRSRLWDENDSQWFTRESAQPYGLKSSLVDLDPLLEEDKEQEEYLDEVDAACQEHEIIDWVFKCATITLLSLILLCALIILVKVWNINPTVSDDSLNSKNISQIGQIPRYNLESESRLPLRANAFQWFMTSWFGKTGSRLLSVPAFVIRSVLTIIMAPVNFVCSKMMYFLYICGFMLFILLAFYWVVHAFLAQTLGDWFMARLRLPSPQQLVHDFAVFTGYAFFNRWWSLTELIKERILNYFNAFMMEGDRSRLGSGAFGSTPGPLGRRNTGAWGGRPYGYRTSVVSNRNSVLYPKSNVYTGLTNIDQKRRLHTITETSNNANNMNSLRAGMRQNGGYEKGPSVLTHRIHQSPSGVNLRDPYSFDNFEKENDQFRNGQKAAYSNPLVTHSPIRNTNNLNRPLNSFGNNHMASRNTGRPFNKPEPIAARGKKGGIAFNL